jgi:O-antigen/teichoic acid export membrane protein
MPPSFDFIPRGFGRDLAWSFAGQCTPILAAIFTIPVLIRTLGTDRFGILALAWTLVGYFNLFDLGMGRALAQVVAEKRGQNDAHQIPSLVWTTFLWVLGLGCIAALLLNLVAPWLVYRALKVPDGLRLESLQSLRLLSVCIPIVMGAAALRGVLDAHERFRETNILRILTGTFIFLGPMLVLPFSTRLLPIMAVLAVTRGLDGAVHLWLCTQLLSWPRLSGGVGRLLPLLRLGGWMTLSNTLSPLMVYLDRFFIGALISMAAVAHYTVPYDMVANMGTIPGALVVILFPAFSAHYQSDPTRTRRFFGQGVRTAALALLPLTVIVIVLSDVGLRWWVGAEFADHGARVLRWLALGRFVNGLAQIPLTFLQGIGRPDLPAKLHLAELPFYAMLAWGLTRAWGIEGTAIAWGVRVGFDTVLLFMMARRFFADIPSGQPLHV